MKLPEYLRYDEREDVIIALEHAAQTLGKVEKYPLNWKWVIVAIHNAFQGTLVCTLSGTHGTGALNKKSFKAMWEWFEAIRDDPDAPCPNERMATPLELYQRAKKPEWMSEFGGQPLETTLEQDQDVERLNELRRSFAHFLPKGWSIETAILPPLLSNVTTIIESLLFSHPSNTLRLDSHQIERANQAIQNIRRLLSLCQQPA